MISVVWPEECFSCYNPVKLREELEQLKAATSRPQVLLVRNVVSAHRSMSRPSMPAKSRLDAEPIADPSLEWKQLNWDAEEDCLFRSLFARFGKNFKAISSNIPNRSYAECVDYYYRTKKPKTTKNKRRRVLAEGPSVRAKAQKLAQENRRARAERRNVDEAAKKDEESDPEQVFDDTVRRVLCEDYVETETAPPGEEQTVVYVCRLRKRPTKRSPAVPLYAVRTPVGPYSGNFSPQCLAAIEEIMRHCDPTAAAELSQMLLRRKSGVLQTEQFIAAFEKRIAPQLEVRPFISNPAGP
eukprot:TRINITY_DN70618_c0_g1_i1.p1 TRINITY_DN70618_c0_g1~~TRINITY_DN70618_c0_g1_i1.p1  ORF type:complete len:305 (+),score=54.72 TRINITY_DN70618_c0_g1_i1:22-915(+)